MEIYNNVLKADGERLMVVHIGGEVMRSWRLRIIKRKYVHYYIKQLHLIDGDVASILNSIDI